MGLFKKIVIIIIAIVVIISAILTILYIKQRTGVNQNEEIISNEGENSYISEQEDSYISEQEEEPKYSDETFIIQYKEGVDEETRIALNELYGVEEVDAIGEDGENIKVLKVKEGYTVEEVLEKYMADPNIEYAEPDYFAEFYYAPNDPGYKNLTAVLNAINAQQAWDITKGESVIVAVIDSGVSVHPDLAGNLLPGYSALASLSPNSDTVGHGTAVAGVVGAIGDNKIGTLGINWKAKILPVKVDDANGNLGISNIAKGIRWAADNGARVMNLSVGSSSDSSTLKSAIDYAYGKGCVIVAATGNDGKNAVSFPARYSNVIGTGASSDGKTKANITNYGTGLDVLAISAWYTTIVTGGYGNMSGTSFSSPQVAGLASLLIGLNPELTQEQVKHYIQMGASGNGVRTDLIGYGVINCGKTLQLMLADIEDIGDEEEVEQIVSNVYEIEETAGISYIENMEEETTVGTLKNNLDLPTKYTVEVTDINGVILTNTQYAGTGSVVKVKNQAEEIVKNYTLVVKGDITGEGEVNIFDIVKITSYIFDESEGFIWNKAIEKAGKITETEGEPNVFDIVRLISYCFDGAGW